MVAAIYPQTDALSGHVPPAIAQVLARRGIDTHKKLNALIDPPHKLPYDPLRITGMDIALRRLYAAVNNGERVGVFGDFDVDGITGTAIISEGLTSLGYRSSHTSRTASTKVTACPIRRSTL